MRIATWNVNSIRARVERVLAVLERWDLDVLAIQETKCKPEQFPLEPFIERGYQVAVHGLNQWNGVAIISRIGLHDIQSEFPGQPAFRDVVEPRALGTQCGPVKVWSLYVPHGRGLADPHFQYKLEYLRVLAENTRQWLTQEVPFVLMGDWNIAPLDSDIWDISEFVDSTHVSQPERDAFNQFAELGLKEVTREFADNYTYWDYKQLRFPRNQGMRIDFAYASPTLAAATTNVLIDRDERKGKGASDHVPVIIELDGTKLSEAATA